MPQRSVARFALLATALLLSACAQDRAAPAPPMQPASADAPPDGRPPGATYRADSIRAVTFDARRILDFAALDSLRALGVTHLTLVSFGFMPTNTTPTVRMHNDAGWFSESDAGIRTLAEETRARGMRLILKPHIWVGEYSAEGQTRDKIAFDEEADWQRWQEQYRRFLLHYARLAEETDAAVLVIGTELASAVRARPEFWRGLIQDVRGVYDGKLTYAANWYEDYEAVSFWDALDYVGVQAYFPLSDAADPSVEALKAGWDEHAAALRRVSERAGRPVLFTEIGYRSVGYAAETPWRWPSRHEDAVPDDTLQARLYEAFFERLWPEPWLAGAILWKWHPGGERLRPTGFSPQNKPATAVIRRWFWRASS